MNEFGSNGDWNAMAHVRFLRAEGGASSGFTADLIEKLYRSLDQSETNLRHWREECGKLHAKLAAHVQNDQVTISLDHYSALLRNHQKLVQMEAMDIEECGNHSAGSPLR